jgi:hypothetical protein
MNYVHDFVVDPNQRIFERELSYYDCRCRIYENPIPTSTVLYLWFFIGKTTVVLLFNYVIRISFIRD